MTTPTPPAGSITATIATFGVVDKDGDVLVKGCVPDGTPVVISGWGHSAMIDARVPVGVGTLHSAGDELRVRGTLFLDFNPEARAAFAVVKTLGAALEWSFGFLIQERGVPSEEQRRAGAKQTLLRVDAFEVSPVLRGAGIGTRTIEAKRAAAQRREIAAVVARFRAQLLKEGWQCRNGRIRWRDESDNEYLRRIGFGVLAQ
jgi:hypothetical protein